MAGYLDYINNNTDYNNDYVNQFAFLDDTNKTNPLDFNLDLGNNNEQGFFNSLTSKDWIDGGLGVAQLGLGLGNYFNNREVMKSQRRGINQQIAESRYAVDRNKQFVANTQQAFA